MVFICYEQKVKKKKERKKMKIVGGTAGHGPRNSRVVLGRVAGYPCLHSTARLCTRHDWAQKNRAVPALHDTISTSTLACINKDGSEKICFEGA